MTGAGVYRGERSASPIVFKRFDPWGVVMSNSSANRGALRYILRVWILQVSLPLTVFLAFWNAIRIGFTVSQVVSARFLLPLLCALVVGSLVAFGIGWVFWRAGLGPPDE